MKKVDYSETIAACDLKLIDLMKICGYCRSRSFPDLGPIDEDLIFFSQKPLAHFQPNFECKLVQVNENSSTFCMSLDPRWLPCLYMIKTL